MLFLIKDTVYGNRMQQEVKINFKLGIPKYFPFMIIYSSYYQSHIFMPSAYRNFESNCCGKDKNMPNHLSKFPLTKPVRLFILI